MAKSKRPPGFSDEGSAFAGAAPEPDAMRQTVELGAGGRLVIPAPMRQALGIKVGDRLTVRVENGQLSIYTYQEGLRRAREVLAKYVPAGVDPVDDFLQWKREQVAIEEAKLDGRKVDD